MRDVSLPQNDPYPARRAAGLNTIRPDYTYDLTYLKPLPLLIDVPSSESFSAKYVAGRAGATAPLFANLLAVDARELLDPFDSLQDFETLFPVLRAPSVMKSYRTDAAFAEQRLSGANPMVLEAMKSLAGTSFTDAHIQIG